MNAPAPSEYAIYNCSTNPPIKLRTLDGWGTHLLRLLPAARRVRRNGFAVEAEARRAIQVCTEGADMRRLQLFQNLFAGMAVAVLQAATDDGPLRSYARQKLGPRGGDTAVMAHFEQRALQARLRQHGLLDRRLDR